MAVAGKLTYEFDAKKFGRHLRHVRTMRKQTLLQVAIATGVWRNQICLIESGKQGIARATFCLAIWADLDLQVYVLNKPEVIEGQKSLPMPLPRL